MEKEAKMGREEDRFQQIIADMARGDDVGHKLGYNAETKRIEPIPVFHDPDGSTRITPEDATLSGMVEGR